MRVTQAGKGRLATHSVMSFALAGLLAFAALLPADARPGDRRGLYSSGTQDAAAQHLDSALYFQDAGQPVAAVVERLWADRYLQGVRERSDNHYRLWRLLERLSAQDQQAPPRGAPPSAAGWWELARAWRAYGSAPQSLAVVLDAWERRHPRHPASESVLLTLRANLPAQRAEPDRVWGAVRPTTRLAPARRIALVLPLSGARGAAGRAIRDGVLAANRELGGAATITTFDSSRQGPLSAYYEAINTRPDLVIGPLDKSAVTAISRRSTLVAPTLALNYAEETSAWFPSSFYQFGLAPEDEATAAATLAINQGHRRAAILAADDAWGQRVAFAFASRFEQLGGTVVTNQTYNSVEADLDAAVRTLLEPTSPRPLWRDSNKGAQQIDALMIAARSDDAQLLHPLLRFHRAINLPVYATGAVYAPVHDTERDADLRGMMFCDAVDPARAPSDPTTDALLASANQPSLPRLHALGQDAMLLSQNLGQLTLGSPSSPSGGLSDGRGNGLGNGPSIDGATGVLSIDSTRRIRRAPPCRRIARARLQPVS